MTTPQRPAQDVARLRVLQAARRPVEWSWNRRPRLWQISTAEGAPERGLKIPPGAESPAYALWRGESAEYFRRCQEEIHSFSQAELRKEGWHIKGEKEIPNHKKQMTNKSQYSILKTTYRRCGVLVIGIWNLRFI